MIKYDDYYDMLENKEITLGMVPLEFRTYDLCLHSMKHGNGINNVPMQFRTLKMILCYVEHIEYVEYVDYVYNPGVNITELFNEIPNIILQNKEYVEIMFEHMMRHNIKINLNSIPKQYFTNKIVYYFVKHTQHDDLFEFIKMCESIVENDSITDIIAKLIIESCYDLSFASLFMLDEKFDEYITIELLHNIILNFLVLDMNKTSNRNKLKDFFSSCSLHKLVQLVQFDEKIYNHMSEKLRERIQDELNLQLILK